MTEVTSWWITDFEKKKETEASRMRREILAPPIQRHFDLLLDQEERELLGKSRRSGPSKAAPSSTRSASTIGPSILSGDDSSIADLTEIEDV